MADRPKERSILSEAEAGIAALKSRRATLEDPFAEPKKKRARKPKKPEKDPFENMSPTQIARTLNRQRIKSQSKDVSRKRTAFAVGRGKVKQVAKKVRKKVRGFIEGKSKF